MEIDKSKWNVLDFVQNETQPIWIGSKMNQNEFNLNEKESSKIYIFGQKSTFFEWNWIQIKPSIFDQDEPFLFGFDLKWMWEMLNNLKELS